MFGMLGVRYVNSGADILMFGQHLKITSFGGKGGKGVQGPPGGFVISVGFFLPLLRAIICMVTPKGAEVPAATEQGENSCFLGRLKAAGHARISVIIEKLVYCKI